jgi:hypothetical protein
MKIGSNPQSLISLTSLLDAAKQRQREDQEKLPLDSRETRVQTRDSERQQLIDKNRQALKKIQDDLRLRNLAKLKENNETDPEASKKLDLNHRESFVSKTNQPTFQKLRQLVDITV